jgi:NitT/TauT family transport system substrate-binding protein
VLSKPALGVTVAVAAVVAAVVVMALLLSGGGSPRHRSAAPPLRLPVGPPGTSAAGILRLGFVADVADAPAMVGSQMGFFQRDLGRVRLEAEPFTSEASVESALADGQLDAAYLDPVLAVGLTQQARVSLVIVAGVTSSGDELVVRDSITRPGQLRGRMLLAPPGGVIQATADAWLRNHGLPVLTRNEAAPSTSAGVLHAFASGAIAGGWEPPPLDAQMAAAGGHVLANAGQATGGQAPSLVLVITSTFLSSHAAGVTGLLEGQVQADQFLAANPVSAEAVFQQQLAAVDDSSLPARVLAASFGQVSFTDSISEPEILAEVREAAAAGLVRPVTDPAGLFDLRELAQMASRN